MLLEFKVNHYKLFNELEFSMEAASIKSLSSNVTTINKKNILKTTAVFGPNNTGKSSFVNAVKEMVEITKQGSLKKDVNSYRNLLDDWNDNLLFEMSYLYENLLYTYGYEIDYNTKNFAKEYLKLNQKLIFNRENQHVNVENKYPELKSYSQFFTSSNQLFLKHVANAENEQFKVINDAIQFFDKFIFLDASELDRGEFFEKTFGLLEKGKTKFINKLITKADVSIDELTFDNKQYEEVILRDEENKLPNEFKKYLSIQATHHQDNRNVKVPLVLIESLGTKKLLALAGYLYEVLEQDKILIIDEIDSSFHAGLTRQIFNLFHINEHSKAQLIATTHDLLLLDLKYLFRKDQIWFTTKEENQGYLYSLDDFKANGEVNLRNNSDILKMYLNGVFGAMMYPDFCSVVEELTDGEK